MAFSNPGNPPISVGDRTASSHQSWLESVVSALELLQWFVTQEMGGGTTGWWAYGGIGYDSAKPSVTGLDMVVATAAGAGFYGGVPFRKPTTGNITIPAPVSNPRIDRVVWDCENGVLERVAGTEGSSPIDPGAPVNHQSICTVYCRVGMTSVKATDDSTNGYITDARVFVN